MSAAFRNRVRHEVGALPERRLLLIGKLLSVSWIVLSGLGCSNGADKQPGVIDAASPAKAEAPNQPEKNEAQILPLAEEAKTPEPETGVKDSVTPTGSRIIPSYVVSFPRDWKKETIPEGSFQYEIWKYKKKRGTLSVSPIGISKDTTPEGVTQWIKESVVEQHGCRPPAIKMLDKKETGGVPGFEYRYSYIGENERKQMWGCKVLFTHPEVVSLCVTIESDRTRKSMSRMSENAYFEFVMREIERSDLIIDEALKGFRAPEDMNK